MVLLDVGRPVTNALLHVASSEVLAPDKLAHQVTHWALPSEDAMAAERRIAAVRSSTGQLTSLIAALPRDMGGEDAHHDNVDEALLGKREQSAAARMQQQQMSQLTDMLESHYAVHEESQHLLEAVDPAASQNLEAVLDDLELANIVTAQTADFQAHALSKCSYHMSVLKQCCLHCQAHATYACPTARSDVPRYDRANDLHGGGAGQTAYQVGWLRQASCSASASA